MSIKSETCFKKDGEPLTVYFSESEANDGASNVRFQYGLDLYPYECPRCGFWHLSPKERQTPSEECHYCTDSHGRPKQLYETREAAEIRAEIIEDEEGIYLRVYPCPHRPDGWHLTKKVAGMY